MNSVPTIISKTSAIASWSGFVYQGKVALYEAISLLISDDKSENYQLKVEHLDDFAIFDAQDVAVSVHQVKAKKSGYRSAYIGAFKDASKVYSDHCNKDTKRYFHLSVSLDDSSDYVDGSTTVNVYKYHDENLYVSLADIDNFISYKIEKYLEKYKLARTDYLVRHKFDRLNSLISSKVNFIHAINQSSNTSQYDAADTNPISFYEIKSALVSEVTDVNDEVYLLERFRNNFISIVDVLIEQSEDEKFVLDLSSYRSIISGLDEYLVAKLYYSLDPKRKIIKADESENDVYRYLEIINSLPQFISEDTIPHYRNSESDKYLPSCLYIGSATKLVALNQIVKNLDEIKANGALLDVLYEYDNLILDMQGSHFRLTDHLRKDGKCTHHGENHDVDNVIGNTPLRKKLIKAKSIIFVSVEQANGEINDY